MPDDKLVGSDLGPWCPHDYPGVHAQEQTCRTTIARSCALSAAPPPRRRLDLAWVRLGAGRLIPSRVVQRGAPVGWVSCTPGQSRFTFETPPSAASAWASPPSRPTLPIVAKGSSLDTRQCRWRAAGLDSKLLRGLDFRSMHRTESWAYRHMSQYSGHQGPAHDGHGEEGHSEGTV